jgi:glycosyltransferase involved in cell wall biosynthesis
LASDALPCFTNRKAVTLNIVFISGHGCIRCQKMALPLLDRGINVHMIANKTPSWVESYKSYSRYFTIDQLIETVKLYSKIADVFHAHNEPSYFVSIVKEFCKVPVILDAHDSFLARMTEEEEIKLRNDGKKAYRVTSEERNNFQLADALIFPGKQFGDAIRNEFRLKQPHLVLPSYLPQRLYRYDGRGWLGGLVYEGMVQIKNETESHSLAHGYRYADYEGLAKEAHKLGIDFHIYAVREDKPFKDLYDPISYVHPALDVERLIKELQRHDWGLVGNVFPSPQWDVAFPNKMFEYIAASVPVVAINAKACSEFIEKHGIGITVGSLEELASRWSEHRACRERLIKVRQQFSMESHIGQLADFYQEVIHAAR